MGIKQRRERERQEIRQSILSATREIAAEEGWQAVTTRKVAERIEYSQSTIYEYFENKEMMLLALLRSGYEQLVEVMQVAFASTNDPEVRLLAMTEAYWDFAFRSPELYQVMYGLAGISFGRHGHPETPVEIRQSFGLAREAIQQWAEVKGVERADLTDLVEARRAIIHGLITLAMVGRIAGGPERVKYLLQETMKDLLFAWSHRPAGSSLMQYWIQEEKYMRISKEDNLVTLINVFETTPEQQQTLVDQWVRFTEEIRNEPGYVGTALHKSTDGTRVINYAHWRSQADFDAFLKRHGVDFAQFGQNSSRIDPHTYDVVYLDEPARS